MTPQNDIQTFDDISPKYSTWIFKYCSTNINNPLFFVWYTDTDAKNTDRLLTYKDGKIFAAKSLTNIKATILSSIDNLIEFENLNDWLNNFNDLEVTVNFSHDLTSIGNEISKNNLDIETIEGFANFVNLYDDFVYQDERNAHLHVYTDNELIRETYEYFYKYIFWPRFNDKEKFKTWNRPQLVINSKELLVKLNDVIRIFDDNIKQAEKEINAHNNNKVG